MCNPLLYQECCVGIALSKYNKTGGQLSYTAYNYYNYNTRDTFSEQLFTWILFAWQSRDSCAKGQCSDNFIFA